MKKPIIFSVLFFILTAISSFGQGIWLEENIDPETGKKVGKFEIHGKIYDIGRSANLEGADLSNADLEGVNLSRARLSGANLEYANLKNANLSYAKLSGDVAFRSANLFRARLSGANLEYANLEYAKLENANLSGALLNYSYLSGASLGGANLSGVSARGTDLSGASLNDANLSGDVAFRGANLSGARVYSLVYDMPLETLLTAVSKGNYDDIQELKPIVEALGTNDESIGEQLTALGQNDTNIGKQLTALAQNDIEMARQIDALGQEAIVRGNQMISLRDKDKSIMTEIDSIKAQLQTLVAQLAEKDAKIAELEKRPTIEQVRDARAGSVVLTVEPDGNNITLGLTIEQSDNLTEWTKLDGEMSRTIPIPDGKKFYRFALDK